MDMIVIPVILEVAVVSMVVMVPVVEMAMLGRLASEAMATVRIVAKHSMVDKDQIVAVRIVAMHSMVVPRSIQHLWTTRSLPGTGPPLIISKHPQHRLPTPWGHTGLIKAPEQLNGERQPANGDWRRVQQTHTPSRCSTRANSSEKSKEMEPPRTSASISR